MLGPGLRPGLTGLGGGRLEGAKKGLSRYDVPEGPITLYMIYFGLKVLSTYVLRGLSIYGYLDPLGIGLTKVPV